MEPIDASSLRFLLSASTGPGLNLLAEGPRASKKSSVLSGTNSRDKKGLNESRPAARVYTPASLLFYASSTPLFPSPSVSFLLRPSSPVPLPLLLLRRPRSPSAKPVAISQKMRSLDRRTTGFFFVAAFRATISKTEVTFLRYCLCARFGGTDFLPGVIDSLSERLHFW